jgi:hypothetical protein
MMVNNLPNGLPFFGEHPALGIIEALVKWMPVERGAVNEVFLQHELEFLGQRFVDLFCGLASSFFQGMVWD